MRKLIVLSVGNTHTEAAIARGGDLGPVERLPTRAVRADAGACVTLAEHASVPCLAACVVPDIVPGLRRVHAGAELRFLDASLVDRPDFSPVDTSTLGADRVANAVAAVCMVAPPVIVLDCGTAITTEIVDADGRFRGGSICPGRGLLRRALGEHTALLPEVAMEDLMPRAAGRNTAEAIRAGVDVGVLGAVERLLRRQQEEVGLGDCTVLATGGDAPYFCRYLRVLTPTPEDFTLRGLAEIAPRVFP